MRRKDLHIIVFKFVGARNSYAAEVFTSRARANRFMDGSQYGVLADRIHIVLPAKPRRKHAH